MVDSRVNKYSNRTQSVLALISRLHLSHFASILLFNYPSIHPISPWRQEQTIIFSSSKHPPIERVRLVEFFHFTELRFQYLTTTLLMSIFFHLNEKHDNSDYITHLLYIPFSFLSLYPPFSL